ncbi:MAG: FtsX-like permease family protein, partial [Woeseiaceae bacterium]|nr:FtsX-like permease family protein [Woeseiaceae bacterium]
MNAVLYAIRSFGRELRSGEVVVLLAAVALAVSALTAVGFLTDRIGRAVERQANEILAADLRLRTPEPVPAEWHDMAEQYDLRTAETASFPSVVFASDLSSLATIKVVSDGYPLRGQVRIADALFGDERVAEGVPDRGTVWADGALLARLGVGVGDRISVGELDVTVDSVLMYRPDQSIGFASLAPSLLLNMEDVDATGLISTGSRVRYAMLVAGMDDNVDAFWEDIQDQLPDNVRSRSREEGSDRANNAADRAQRFLSLTAVISLLLSAVAIAMSARRFAHRRMDTVALMKSLGASQKFIISAASVQLMMLGIMGVAIGSGIGFLVEQGVTNMLADIIQSDLPPVGWTPVFLACGSALILLMGFAMPSLIQLRDTPPLRVLRHDEMPPPPSRLFVAGTSLIAVAVMLYQAIGDGLMLLIVLGGMGVVSTALYAAGRGLVIVMGR